MTTSQSSDIMAIKYKQTSNEVGVVKPNFMTLKELSDATGIKYYKLQYDAKRGTIPVQRNGRHLIVDTSHPHIKSMLANPLTYAVNRVRLKPRPVLYQGKTYPSVRALATAVKRNVKTVTYWLLSGKATYLDKI